jgi:hypothetical protein
MRHNHKRCHPLHPRCSTSVCPPLELSADYPRASCGATSPRVIYRSRPLRVCRTVPRLATGALRFSYPQTLSGCAIACRSAPVAMLASAFLSEASVRLPFLSSLPPKDGAAWILSNPESPRVPASAPRSGNSECGNSWAASVCRIPLPVTRGRYRGTLPGPWRKKAAAQMCG